MSEYTSSNEVYHALLCIEGFLNAPLTLYTPEKASMLISFCMYQYMVCWGRMEVQSQGGIVHLQSPVLYMEKETNMVDPERVTLGVRSHKNHQ